MSDSEKQILAARINRLSEAIEKLQLAAILGASMTEIRRAVSSVRKLRAKAENDLRQRN
jgi:hypothetical protein